MHDDDMLITQTLAPDDLCYGHKSWTDTEKTNDQWLTLRLVKMYKDSFLLPKYWTENLQKSGGGRDTGWDKSVKLAEQN